MTPHNTFEQDRLEQEVNNFLFEIEQEKKRKEEEQRMKELEAERLSEFKKQTVIDYYINDYNILSQNATSCENGILYYTVCNEEITLYFVEKFLNFSLYEALEGGFYLRLSLKNKTYFETFAKLLNNEVFANEILLAIKNINIEKSKSLNNLIKSIFMESRYSSWHIHQYLTEFTDDLFKCFKKSHIESFVNFFSGCTGLKLEYATCLCGIRKARYTREEYDSINRCYLMRGPDWVHGHREYTPLLETVPCHEKQYDIISEKIDKQKKTTKKENLTEYQEKFIVMQILRNALGIILAVITAIAAAFVMSLIKIT